MSIAEKLTTIAENEQKVYDAGYAKGAEEGGGSGINPEWTDWRYFSCYNNRSDLVAKLKYSDTSNGTNFSSMCIGCGYLTSIPEIDTSNGTDFQSMFNGCGYLTSIPEIDTSNGTNFQSMFNFCSRLTSIPKLNLTKGTHFNNMFNYCTALTDIGLVGTIKSSGLNLSPCTNLTHETLMKFINALVDYSSSTSTYTLTLGSTNLAKLTDEEKAIATQKGWTLA